MKGLATTGSGAETPATSPLPTIATGARARLASSGFAANDNRLSLGRRLLAPGFFAASVVLLLLAI